MEALVNTKAAPKVCVGAAVTGHQQSVSYDFDSEHNEPRKN